MAALRAVELFESGLAAEPASPAPAAVERGRADPGPQAAERGRADSGPQAAEPVRADLALAAILAGYAVGAAGFAVHHAVCQTNVRLLGTPHAQTNAAVLPHSAAFVAARAPEALAGVAPDRIARLAARAGVGGLSELGVREDQLPAVAEAAAHHPAIGNTPGGPPSPAELIDLLRAAL
jgi:alcohol dehydrogenase class IV